LEVAQADVLGALWEELRIEVDVAKGNVVEVSLTEVVAEEVVLPRPVSSRRLKTTPLKRPENRQSTRSADNVNQPSRSASTNWQLSSRTYTCLTRCRRSLDLHGADTHCRRE
jgi:hypothetical protein